LDPHGRKEKLMKPRLPYLLTPLIATTVLLGACRTMAERDGTVEIRELARLSICNTPSKRPTVRLFADTDALLAWQNERGVQLLDPAEPSPGGPFAVAELGARNPGGATLVIGRQGRIYGSTLSLQTSVIGSSERSAEELTSPCVLVKLPAGDYRSVDLRDSGDRSLANSASPPPPLPVARPAQ
jgi:hypothetical protein